ncbi:MAG: DNA primase [Rhabdochlamydiaceae bacterium]|nr:DNA primase [Candidatus Amphrikana amoebophyrae]
MGYTRQSLEELRNKVDLIEVVSSHVKMTRSGAYYKGLCPFHNEKSPSFLLQKGDAHYHCFGCGAHGDAIAFLMNYLKMTFAESVKTLAEKFGVKLEETDFKDQQKQAAISRLKSVMNDSAKLYNFYLLHTDEGHKALQYLYQRGLDLNFINTFQIGYAPAEDSIFLNTMREKGYKLEELQEVGLIRQVGARARPFFSSRITIPMHDIFKNVIGFSCRKIEESTFGPKYINSPETPLFKKSRVLFGLYFSRKRIAKEQKALIVEGQIDALRLIEEGFDFTIAGQGTAFSDGHVQELLKLGVKHVYLAFDGDNAGQEAALKVGQMFQKEAVEVSVLKFGEKEDPDTILMEKGAPGMIQKIDASEDYLSFLVSTMSKRGNIHTPAGKNEVVRSLVKTIHEWEHPLMVHEGLKRLAALMQVPESVVVPQSTQAKEYIPKTASISQFNVDPNRVLETDLLRWILLADQTEFSLIEFVAEYLGEDDFVTPLCKDLYEIFLDHYEKERNVNLIAIASSLEDAEHQLFLAEILQKKVNLEKAKEGVKEAVMKILQRNWMQRTEEVKSKIQSGGYSQDEVMGLVKEFNQLKKAVPQFND